MKRKILSLMILAVVLVFLVLLLIADIKALQTGKAWLTAFSILLLAAAWAAVFKDEA